MFRRRRLILVSLTLLVLASLILAWNFTPPPTAITRENALKIKPGITLVEVEAILGGPARDELGGEVGRALGVWPSGTAPLGTAPAPVVLHERVKNGTFTHSRYRWRDPLDPFGVETRYGMWLSSEAWIEIHLDVHGRVSRVEFDAVQRRTSYGIGNWRF